MFLKSNSSLVGASEGVSLRFVDNRNDHEVELAAIIGKAGTNISAENALDHVAGYSIGLDMTTRGKELQSFRKFSARRAQKSCINSASVIARTADLHCSSFASRCAF